MSQLPETRRETTLNVYEVLENFIYTVPSFPVFSAELSRCRVAVVDKNGDESRIIDCLIQSSTITNERWPQRNLSTGSFDIEVNLIIIYVVDKHLCQL
eukprot:m.286418 g.286418  ORF g.286418 m.286418 type:complete len:98 (+) comp40692_c0_seq2:177-470(+)